MNTDMDGGFPPEPDPLHTRVGTPGRGPDGRWSAGFLLAHATPVLLLIALASVLMGLHVDQWLADRVYAWQGQHWAYRNSFIAEDLIHVVGRDMATAAWIGLFGAWLLARRRSGLAAWRRPLGYLLLATLLATVTVAWIKSWSNMDCPWDLLRYGGSREHISLLAVRPLGMPRAACFPAGHASGGYSWMALYFFFLMSRPRWRWHGLAVGICLGLLFGLTQQLRGAHFASHDLWTAAISWASALGVYLLFHSRRRAPASARRQERADRANDPRAAVAGRPSMGAE